MKSWSKASTKYTSHCELTPPWRTVSLFDGFMAWHSLQVETNHLKNLQKKPAMRFPLTACCLALPPCFFLFDACWISVSALCLRETLRVKTGVWVTYCQLPYCLLKLGLFATYTSGLFLALLDLLINTLLSETSLVLVLALVLQLLLLLLLFVLLLLDDISESLLLTLLVRLIVLESVVLFKLKDLVGGQGKSWGKSRPFKNKWSAGESGDPGVTSSNSNSFSWTAFSGTCTLLFCTRFAMEHCRECTEWKNASPSPNIYTKTKLSDINYISGDMGWLAFTP